MRPLLIALAFCAAFAGIVSGQGIAGFDNTIGIYTIPDPTPESAGYSINYFGPDPVVDAYVVLSSAVNHDLGGTGGEGLISHLGGFEFRLVLPETVLLLSAAYPAGANAINFLTPPNFLVGCNLPVTAWATMLLHVQLMWNPADYCKLLFLAPVFPDRVQSIPGLMAITDADDAFRLNAAYPSSGDFSAPVFYLGCWDGAESGTWGGVKSLYR